MLAAARLASILRPSEEARHDGARSPSGTQVAPRARPIDGAGSPSARPSTESRARKHGTARKQTQRSVEPTLETSRQASRQRHREIDFILTRGGRGQEGATSRAHAGRARTRVCDQPEIYEIVIYGPRLDVGKKATCFAGAISHTTCAVCGCDLS